MCLQAIDLRKGKQSMGYFNPIPGRYTDVSGYTDNAPAFVSQAEIQAELLKEFRNVTGIDDISSISLKDFPEIERLAGEHTLRREPLSAAVPKVPSYPQLQRESIAGLVQVVSKIIDTAGQTQTEAFDTLKHINWSLEEQHRVLQTLASSATSNHAISVVANATIKTGEQRIRLASIAQDMGHDANEMWKSVALGVGVGVGVVGAVGALLWRLSRGSWF
jgi:hypothetical protein